MAKGNLYPTEMLARTGVAMAVGEEGVVGTPLPHHTVLLLVGMVAMHWDPKGVGRAKMVAA